jgi:hypothetical protein
MGSTPSHGARSAPARAITVRNVALALAGAAVLVLAPADHGPFSDLIQGYAGDVAVSFALYFAAVNATSRYPRSRLLAAFLTLLAVGLFELTDGFGVMANTYDPGDLLADAAGVGLAVIVDIVTTPIMRGRHERPPNGRGEAPA